MLVELNNTATPTLPPMPIKIKLVISELPPESVPSSVWTYFLSWIGKMPVYGFSHAALHVGAFKLDWTTAELVMPTRHSSSHAQICIDLAIIETTKEYDHVRDMVCIVRAHV